MNKDKILEEIQKTKEHLANMEKMLEECEYERFKPKTGEDYYCIDDENNVRRVNFNHMNAYGRDRIRAYNCFRTKEDALQEAEKILVRRQLEDIARRLNKGEPFDWNKFYQPKYYIYLGNYDMLLENSTATSKSQGTVYCLDENFRDVAIQEIGKERLKKYLKDF